MTSDASIDDAPRWDPEQQIYIGGKLPEDEEFKALLAASSDGSLRLFGYGSLCWNPGTGALAKPGVIGKLGRAKGYKRCWAQKSTDHRGNPKFPGIVCTLLEDGEVLEIQSLARIDVPEIDKPTMTEGVIYWIPRELVHDCLEELDFREKGGVSVQTVCLLYDLHCHTNYIVFSMLEKLFKSWRMKLTNSTRLSYIEVLRPILPFGIERC